MGKPRDPVPELILVASKQLPEPCADSTISYCPTMDLVAVATDNGVVVFRLNGQRVFGITNGGGKDTWTVVRDGLRWRSDGQLLAIACSDAIVRLVNAFSGKITHQLKSPQTKSEESAQYDISSLSWAPCFANGTAAKHQLDTATDNLSIDDLLGVNAQISSLLKIKADLPRALGELDVESSLPKLATLPATGGDDDVFSARTSIDNIFHNARSKNFNEMVDVLLTCYEDLHATTNVKIFSSFEIGNIQLSSSLASNNTKIPAMVIQHASHPLLPNHFLLVKHATSLHLLRLDLNFITQTAPHYLPIVAVKATQLAGLLRYLAQIESQLSHEIKAAFELPSRYLSNVTDSIKQQNPDADFKTQAWHLVCTGECSDVMREWLVDEVGERGVKRWEKGVGDALDVVRRGVSECILPCLERIYFVLSRLEGLARFEKSRKVLGLDEKMIGGVRATVNVVNLLSNDLLRQVGEEIRAFESFIKWFKSEFEIQSLEVESERREELSAQTGDEIDVRAVLGYLDGGIRGSSVLNYLRGGAKMESSDFMLQENHQGDDESQFYERYKAVRSKTKKKDSVADIQLPKLDELVVRLKAQCEKVFEDIATTLRKSIQHSYVMTLETDCDSKCVAMRVSCSAQPMKGNSISYEILVAAKANKFPGVVILTKLEGFGSNTNAVPTRRSTMELDGEVIDLQFVDDTHLLVLVSGDRGSSIYECETSSLEASLLHRFELQQRQSQPKKLEINGRKGRRVVCVLDRDGMRYEIFDLDNTGPQESDTGDSDEAMLN